MLSLDIRTLSFLAMITSVLLAAGLQLAIRLIAKDSSLRLWALGATVNGAAYVLLAVRGIVPDLISIVVANTLLIMGSGWLYLGNRQYLGLPREWPWYWLVAAISAPALAYFTYFAPSLSARIVVLSGATSGILLAGGLVLLRRRDPGDQAVRWFVSLAFIVTGTFLGVRAVATAILNTPGQDFMAVASPIQTFALVFGIALNVALAMGLPLLVSGKMQRRLLESENRFSSIFSASPDPISVIRLADSVITDVNPAFLAMHEMRREEVVGHTGKDIGIWQNPNDRDEVHDKLLQFGRVENFLYRFRRKSGETGDGLISAETVRIGGEQFIVAIVSDVSALIKAREALREKDATYRVLFESSVDALSILDPQTGCFIDCNPAAISMHGTGTRENFIGISPAKLSPEYQPDGQASAPLAMQHLVAAANGSSHTFEWMNCKADGSQFPVQVTLCPIDLDGKRRVLAIARDITERKQAEDAIRVSEARLRRAELASKSGNWELHLDAHRIFVSEGAARLYGLDNDKFDLATVQSMALPECRAYLDAALNNLIANDQPYDVEFKIRAADTGEIKDIHSVAIFDKRERILFGIIQDITERKQAEVRLQLAAGVFTHAREGIMITDADGVIVDVNDAFTRITNYNREEALGQNPRILSSGRQSLDYYAAMWQALAENGHWTGEVWNRRKNGEVYAEILTISSVLGPAGKVQNYVALFTDITQIKKHQQQLEHIAHYDVLTQLPNRFLMADRLQQAIAQCQRRNKSLAVVYLDLDGFKAVNDSHGHDVGDRLLIAVSQRMKEALREGDTLARIGGDEFAAVLVDLERPQVCEPVLERLLQAAADPVTVGDAVLQVSASIGVTLYPQDKADADLLLRHADQAMYQAKLGGKNRYQIFAAEPGHQI